MPVTSPFLYGPGLQQAIWAAKNNGRRDVLQQLTRELIRSLVAYKSQRFDVVTWVPSSRIRRRQRGYDQGKVIAKMVGHCLGTKVRRLLLRASKGDLCQLGKTRLQRLEGPSLVAVSGVPARILLVDDVVTTGASLAAANRALKERGALQLIAATIASVHYSDAVETSME